MTLRRANFFLCVLLAVTAAAASAQASGPGAGWTSVEALSPGTDVRIQTDHGKARCHVASVTREQITCSKQSFAAGEIQTVKLESRGRSTGIGALIGGGAGAGIGAGIGTAVKGDFFVNSNGKAAGVGAALFGLVGAGVGALVGHGTDFASRTVYRR